MTYTSIEQSKALIKLGLDEKTADLTITSNSITPYIHINGLERGNKEYPCWSAEALLELLPSEVYIKEKDDTACLKIMKVGAYIVCYDSKERDDIPNFIHSMGDDLADVLFKVIEWLLTNKLI